MGNLAAPVAAWALEHLGLTLMPWQLVALEGMTALAAPTELQHRRSLISVARQSGKTTLLQALIGWWLTEGAKWQGQPQTILHMAHNMNLVREEFEDLAPVIEQCAPRARIMRSFGRQMVRMPDGSKWITAAASRASAHGLHPDLAVVDELWDVAPTVIEDAVGPSQRARPSPLLAAFSTAGDGSSSLMLQWRENGLRAIDAGQQGQLFMAEWSPPPGADPADPDTWTWANPALGHTIKLDTIRAEAGADDRNAFLRASLNLWVASDKGWLPTGAWEACRAADWTEPDAGGWLVCEQSTDGQRWVGLRAWPTGQVATVFTVATEPDAWQAIEAVMVDPAVQLAYTPPLELHLPPRWQARARMVGYQETKAWTAGVRGAILDRRVHHNGETLLAEHVERAAGVYSDNALTLSSKKSAGPIELARCLVWGHALATMPSNRRRAAVAFG
jgi:hypothetical protein